MAFDWIVGIGAITMGLLIGCMVGVAFADQKALPVQALKSFVSVLAGGAVLALFHFLVPRSQGIHEIWLYPVGLLVGFSIACVFSVGLGARSEVCQQDAATLLAYLEGRAGEAISLQEVGPDLMMDYLDLQVTIQTNSQIFRTVRMTDGAPGVELRRIRR